MENYFSKDEILNNLIATAILLAIALVVRYLALRTVRRVGMPTNDSKRTWIVQIRNLTFMVVGIGLVTIWATEIRNFAFSIAAVAVALVIGTKELILCFLGGVLKTGSKSFKIGDRIEVDGVRGDVIDMNFFTTTVFEIGPGQILHQYTGRKLVIPNSLFLNHPVSNETFTAKYFFHILCIPLSVRDNWEVARKILLEKANEECRDFLEDAKRFITRMGQIEGLETPSVNPRVSLHVHSPEEIHLLLRVPAPPHRQGPIEQAIVEKFLKEMAKFKAEVDPRQTLAER